MHTSGLSYYNLGRWMCSISKDTHNLAIQSLKTVGEVMKIADAISLINGN